MPASPVLTPFKKEKKINVLESKSIESTQSETHRKRKKQEKAN